MWLEFVGSLCSDPVSSWRLYQLLPCEESSIRCICHCEFLIQSLLNTLLTAVDYGSENEIYLLQYVGTEAVDIYEGDVDDTYISFEGAIPPGLLCMKQPGSDPNSCRVRLIATVLSEVDDFLCEGTSPFLHTCSYTELIDSQPLIRKFMQMILKTLLCN